MHLAGRASQFQRRRVAFWVSLATAALLVAMGCSPQAGDSSQSDSAESSSPSSLPDVPESSLPENSLPDSPESDRIEPDGQDQQSGELADPDDLPDDIPSGGVGPLRPAEVAAALAELPGRLAVGDGPRLFVASPDGQALAPIDGIESGVASQPTWSRMGDRLVWSFSSGTSQRAKVQAFDGEGEAADDPLVSVVEGTPAFYFQWGDEIADPEATDPDATDNQDDQDAAEGEAPDPTGDPDASILFLHNAGTGAEVEAGSFVAGSPARAFGSAAPFFVAWSPSGKRLALHLNDTDVFLIDFEKGRPVSPPVLAAQASGFSAPAWLNDEELLIANDGWLLKVAVPDTLNFRVQELPAVRVAPVPNPVQFVVSPDGSKVAYQAPVGEVGSLFEVSLPTRTPTQGRFQSPIQAESDPEESLLSVLDLATGDVSVVSERQAWVWEWSPDGSKLAWFLSQPGVSPNFGRWNFWSPEGPLPGNEFTSSIVLTEKEATIYFPFFVQYAQSVTRWSPDSTAFAMTGSTGGRRGVWIQLVDQPAGPALIGNGDFVTWGPGASPQSAGPSPV